jgi:hypothetical protein
VYPVLKESAADYLLIQAHAARTVPRIEIDSRFAREASQEERARFEQNLRDYYQVANEEAHAQIRVNRVEGRRAFVLGAVTIPLRLHFGCDVYIVEFLALVVVWILLWDSIEMLLWDAMLLRMRYRATRKLRDATIRYSPRRSPSETSPLR